MVLGAGTDGKRETNNVIRAIKNGCFERQFTGNNNDIMRRNNFSRLLMNWKFHYGVRRNAWKNSEKSVNNTTYTREQTLISCRWDFVEPMIVMWSSWQSKTQFFHAITYRISRVCFVSDRAKTVKMQTSLTFYTVEFFRPGESLYPASIIVYLHRIDGYIIMSENYNGTVYCFVYFYHLSAVCNTVPLARNV